MVLSHKSHPRNNRKTGPGPDRTSDKVRGYRIKATAKRLIDASLCDLYEIFSPWLELPATFGSCVRDRLYRPDRTFWLFLSQVLSADGSCRESVRKFLAWLALQGKTTASSSDSGYCQARKRLPLEAITQAHQQISEKVLHAGGSLELWYGCTVKVVDGSTISMPDTPENQSAYPQQKSQKPGCGFPILRIVAVFHLATGILVDLAHGAFRVHERTLFRSLWKVFQPGDVVLADRGFCSYVNFYYLSRQAIECVMRRLHRKPCILFKRLGRHDRLVLWTKHRTCPPWLNRHEWLGVPDCQLVRELTFGVDVPGFRTKTINVVTTLLDHKMFPKQAFADLYRRRWWAELSLRDIKTSLKMDVLRCMTPTMIQKELWMHLIAYNLIRAVMLKAAETYRAPIRRMSFKGTVATVRQWAPILAAANLDEPQRRQMTHALLSCLATDLLPYRPSRNEPRARKRRPKPYPLLNKPRHLFHEIPHQSRYRNNPETPTCKHGLSGP